MKMKNAVPVVMGAILAIAGLAGCKPHGVPAKSSGSSLKSVNLAAGVTPEALIQAFQQNGFEAFDGSTFEQFVPSDAQSRAYIGVVALRDTNVKGPNEFVVGVGSEAVFWYESHDLSGNGIADWETHIKKRIDLVEKLAASKN
jgi:hypothetical protein